MPSPPSTRGSDARGRRSSAFVRERHAPIDAVGRTKTMPIRTGLRRLAPVAIAVGFLMIGMMSLAPVARAAADHPQIGVLIFDKVLTSDVTAPMEVFGNASKKPEFSEYQVAI